MSTGPPFWETQKRFKLWVSSIPNFGTGVFGASLTLKQDMVDHVERWKGVEKIISWNAKPLASMPVGMARSIGKNLIPSFKKSLKSSYFSDCLVCFQSHRNFPASYLQVLHPSSLA